MLGFTTRALTATSDAVVAYVGSTTCIKPVAIPYQALLDQLYTPGSKPTSYNLTDADVANLQGSHPSVQLKLGTDATQGNFYLVEMGPYQYANGTFGTPNWGGDNIFEDRFAGNGTCSMMVGPGDWLKGKTGNAAGPAEKGYEDLCGVTITGNGDYPCSSEKKFKVALWSTEDDAHCTPRCFLVKYTGVFVVTKYSKFGGSTPDGLWGYFTEMPSDGAFSTVPSPLKKLALVK
jgi:hypothetical protein